MRDPITGRSPVTCVPGLPWPIPPATLSDLERPTRFYYRHGLPRLIRDVAYSLRELAAGRSGSLTGKQRYDILQIANPLLTAAVVVDAHSLFLSADQQRLWRLLREQRKEEYLARRREPAAQATIEQPPLPEICLTDIGPAWLPVAEKAASDEWRWALPRLHQIGFERERAARRIVTTERQRDGRTVLLARRCPVARSPKVVFGRSDAGRLAEART